ncbi:MAG: ribosome biogenesis GTP-binding protein YihA/YsxC [Endomicrobiia bacterium]|nr:ribosome biogenesis GTP-binding protein YihA/YsxC [Endomicrobiaceae bacterium]MDD3053526.1 ribosome biogenesis GTP-binding protein YihA/YsxC [Endomicrobiaceae bacterium]MDD3922488.1 ribosome biogenesis GTP-binding protein YihA/YsxC [Endomicrobiaceae bacterium]MDD5102448.1 ribosome biogenesis GTP-binding protein YihA/YsxC [Endomicrobiaceae bacterium]
MSVNLSNAVFFISSVEPELLPESISEVAFVGRSNVGKSSVINAITKKKNLARTSKTPGRTRAINVFTPSRGRWLVDLPGYGFARVSDDEKETWKRIIEGYITTRKTLKAVYVLIDAFVGPSELDFVMMKWLRDLSVPFKIIANKTDKISNLDLEQLKTAISENLEISQKDIYCISAKTQAGVGILVNDIGNLLL